MIKTFKFKLYTSKKKTRLHNNIGIAANIYNHCIALHKRYYRLFKKHIGLYQLQKHVTKLKKLDRFKHWNLLNSQAIQDITERIDRAYKLFFQNIKKKIKSSPPSFCKSSKYKSYTLKQTGYKFLSSNKIKIGKETFKYHKSRNIEGAIKTVTVKRDMLSDIYIYFVCEFNNQPFQIPTGKSVGLDFGLKTFLTSMVNLYKLLSFISYHL